jgi:hypothetical protein
MKTGVDKCFYNPNDRKVLTKHKLEVWPGYVFTVDEFEGGVYLQVIYPKAFTALHLNGFLKLKKLVSNTSSV